MLALVSIPFLDQKVNIIVIITKKITITFSPLMIIDVSSSVHFQTTFHDVYVSGTSWSEYRGRGTALFVAQRQRSNFELPWMAAESTLSSHSLSQQES
jgi:hypothetical protein